MHQTQWSAERPLPPPVSLTSQSHHEKPPEVTCTSRGTPGCLASTRERPRETFFNITGWGIDLDYFNIEWFALETNRVDSVIFPAQDPLPAQAQSSLQTWLPSPLPLTRGPPPGPAARTALAPRPRAPTSACAPRARSLRSRCGQGRDRGAAWRRRPRTQPARSRCGRQRQPLPSTGAGAAARGRGSAPRLRPAAGSPRREGGRRAAPPS